MTEVKIKACEKPVIEAYWRTLIERAFRNNARIEVTPYLINERLLKTLIQR